MLFSSMTFLWIFLPIAIIYNYIVNFVIRDKKKCIYAKNTFLFFASLIFYAYGGIYFLAIMISSIIINYFGGLYISSLPDSSDTQKAVALFVVILLNLLILFYFKYFNMILVVIEQVSAPIENAEMLKNIFTLERTNEINIKNVVLPIGISFFTFQAMSYVIDVYKGIAKPQKSIMEFGLYVALFPQLIAGPIVKYSDIEEQIGKRKETVSKFAEGIKRFCYGLGKKVIIANTFASIVDNIWALNLNDLGMIIAWFGAIAYAMQIYYDFSGYSDMAIGLGKMFGFEFKENFNYPYIATSIVDFWRRWHMSLTNWFREYVYFSIGGSKKGLFRTCINILFVFLLTGIWHGANWTFILWGVVYAILQIIERLFLGKILEKNPIKIFNWLYTMLVVLLLWILFRANNIYDAITYIQQLFSFQSKYNILSFLSMKVIYIFIIAILCMGVLQKAFLKKYQKIKNKSIVLIFDYALQIGILIYSILLITGGTYNPFIYFQF